MQQVCICELASPPCSLLWLSLSLPGTLRGLLRYLRMEDMAFHRWEGSCHGTGQITLPGVEQWSLKLQVSIGYLFWIKAVSCGILQTRTGKILLASFSKKNLRALRSF